MNDSNGMDELLSEYMEEEHQIDDDAGTMFDPNASETTTAAAAAENELGNYYAKTQDYYKTMSYYDIFSALYFTLQSGYICATEYMKYKVGWKSKTNAIIDVSKRLANINMMYVKIFQAFATNKNIVSPELNQFFSDYTDHVEYTHDEYDDQDLLEIEHKAVDCYPYKPIKILNNYKPIKSGLMSLIFKGKFIDGPEDADVSTYTDSGPDDANDGRYVAIKYLRKDILTNFSTSMNNLVVFAKLTKYVPFIRTLNIETLILQNIVSLKEQVCFHKEVTNIKQYYKSWKGCDYVKIPEPYPDFTNKINPNIIVMEFINGRKITDINLADVDTFGSILALFSAKAAFCNSMFHADLHPGNILFIKETPESASESTSESKPVYKIGVLDFGIVGHLTRVDQEILFKSTKLVYQKKYKRMVHMILTEMSEDLNPNYDATTMTLNTVACIPKPTDEIFIKLHKELLEVIVEYSTPEIKMLGVNELYTINYILNSYNLTFKRSLYRLFLTIAIMDSIATKLGSEMSYMQHMADVVIKLFGIDPANPEEDD
jgi:predicted unusual protein kinase regulating ubiquinone biosynthesis (AarF/ABC1/UbiB family)